MLITKASSSEALLQIAETIKDQYTNKKIDEITLSIHNENSGNYEEELLYEPISKGKINRHIRFSILWQYKCYT